MVSTRAAIPKILRNANSSASLLRGFGSDPRVSRAARNFDNRHVEIVCAASTRVNVSVFYQCVDTANRPWPTSVVPGGGEFPVGQRVARSLPERWPAYLPRGMFHYGFKAIDSRTAEGQPRRCPFPIGTKMEAR